MLRCQDLDLFLSSHNNVENLPSLPLACFLLKGPESCLRLSVRSTYHTNELCREMVLETIAWSLQALSA